MVEHHVCIVDVVKKLFHVTKNQHQQQKKQGWNDKKAVTPHLQVKEWSIPHNVGTEPWRVVKAESFPPLCLLNPYDMRHIFLSHHIPHVQLFIVCRLLMHS